MEIREVLYLAILNKSDFKGFYSRFFLFPEGAFPADVSADWYYLNRIDHYGCLEKVVKFDELFDPIQREHLQDLMLIVQCAWCKKFKTASPEGDTWTELEEIAWRPLTTTITHGICPSCGERAFPKRA